MMFVKVHEAYRKVVAVCDEELLGKKFLQDKLQLDVKQDFYGGQKLNEQQAIKLLKEAAEEDATFNLVGKEAVAAGIKAGIILNNKRAIIKVQGIPHALSLL